MPIGPNQTTGSLIGRISEIKRNAKLKNALLLDINDTSLWQNAARKNRFESITLMNMRAIPKIIISLEILSIIHSSTVHTFPYHFS